MANIKASVGIRNGKQCYNVPADQQIVQQLLDRISVGNGGCESDGDTGWTSAKWGQCAPDLYDAICRFQKVNRFRLDYSSDGHVDPGGGTIQLMTQLSQGGVTGLPGGAGGQLGDSGRQPNVTVDLSALQPSGFRSKWQLTGSSSLSVSVGPGAMSVGDFYLTDDPDPSATPQNLHFVSVGVGVSLAPASVSGGPQELPSTGSYLYTAATSDIGIDDIAGPATIWTGGLGYGVGLYRSTIWFNCPTAIAVVRKIYQASSDPGGADVTNIMRHLNTISGAVCTLTGIQATTPDLGGSLVAGLAWKRS
jgi:hypothetical protein